ncbi:MAG: hypothetical protein D6771_02600 [Zetaproteobacteria bacterium]|nr:MAG: hypothetical protein D6771_02600 [Zetaproteobacteria bacterium]
MKRANLAKAVYDLGKLSFGGVVLAQIAKGNLDPWIFGAGIASTIAAFVAAWIIDTDERGK